MINHSFGIHSPKTATIYNSQAGVVVFMCCFILKITALPGRIASELESGTIWFYMIIFGLDFLLLCVAYPFFRDGADETLRNSNCRAYKIGLFFLGLFFALKSVVYFASVITRLSLAFYAGISPFVVILLLLLPVTYLAVKGIKCIARSCELCFLLVLFIFVGTLVFIKTDFDFGRNLPVFPVEPADFFKNGFRFGIYMGDWLPLIFVRIKKKRFPYFGTSVWFTFALMIIVILLGIASYGESLGYVDNLILRLAGFNQLAAEIGRLEWTTLCSSVIMIVFHLSFCFWGVFECGARLVGRKLPFQILLPLSVFIICLTVPTAQSISDAGFTPVLGYVLAGFVFCFTLFITVLKRRDRDALLRDPSRYKRIPKPEGASL